MALPGSNPTLEGWTATLWLPALYAVAAVAILRGWVRGAARLYAVALLLGALSTQNAIIRLYKVHGATLKFPWSRGNDTVVMEPAVERTPREELYVWDSGCPSSPAASLASSPLICGGGGGC